MVIETQKHKETEMRHIYTPEMNEAKPEAQIEAHLSHYGRHYFLYTNEELKGRGVRKIDTDNYRGLDRYKVTFKAYEKICQEYEVSEEAFA